MTRKETITRAGRAAAIGARRQRHDPAADGDFPPLSISREDLLREGSDREFRRLIYTLIAFAGMLERHRSIYGAYIGVTGPQYTMMSIIAGTPNTTVSDIAKTMSVSNQFITSEVGKLADRGIVEKWPDEADRRSMLLNLTPTGQRLLRELGPLRRESNDLMYRSLTGDRARMLQETMDALIADGEIALHELDAPHRRGQKAPTAAAKIGTRGAAPRAVRKARLGPRVATATSR